MHYEAKWIHSLSPERKEEGDARIMLSDHTIRISPPGVCALVSLIITVTLLLLLGVGRGLIGHRNVVLTALETLGITAAAALAGFLIGKLVTR